MLGSLSWFILNVHEEANYCHGIRIARILSFSLFLSLPSPRTRNPRLFWSRTDACRTARPISLLVSKECLRFIATFQIHRFSIEFFRRTENNIYILSSSSFFFGVVSWKSHSFRLDKFLFLRAGNVNRRMYESIASTIYLSSSHEGSNKTGRRANKDAYLLCTRSNGPYNSARSERRVGFEEGGLIGRRGIKTGREIDSSNGIRGHFFLNSRRRVTHRFVSPVESIRPKCHFYFQWNPPFHLLLSYFSNFLPSFRVKLNEQDY